MKKKFVTLGIMMALSMTVAAGCGQKAGNETTAQETAESTAADTAAADTAPADSTVEDTTAAEAETTQARAELKEIVVGASPAPHAAILNAAKEVLASKGYELKIVEYTDYVQPNNALDSGDLDANYFQHKPYLDSFNAQNGTKLVSRRHPL